MKGLDIDNRYNIREEKNALTEELKKYTMSFQEIESSLNIEKTIEERNKKMLKERLDNICLSDDDIDEVNVILSKCIQIYCNEIKRYRNPRGESLFIN